MKENGDESGEGTPVWFRDTRVEGRALLLCYDGADRGYQGALTCFPVEPSWRALL